MEITARNENDNVVVSVKGRMDAVTSPEFETELNELITQGQKNIIVDFNELEYISSAGLRSILATAKKLKAKGGQLVLSSLKDVVKEVFDISGFSSIIPIYESVESAFEQI